MQHTTRIAIGLGSVISRRLAAARGPAFGRAARFYTAQTDATKSDPVQQAIHTAVTSNPCVLYMKGTPAQPQCGFSNAVVKVLDAEGAKYVAFDVLADPAIREGVKKYSSWPTIPQLFIGGEFIGGCDITLQLYKSGELSKKLEAVGAKPKQAEQKK